MKRHLTVLTTLLFSILLPTQLQASTVLTTEHADIGLGYEGGSWDLHIHDETNDVEREADDTLLFVGPNAMGSASSFHAGFTGAAQGEDIWVLPQSQNPTLLFLGIGAEETDPADFNGWDPGDSRIFAGPFDWLRLNLEGVSGPGHFSVYSDDSTIWMSTASAPADGNSLYILQGGHAHFNLAFTEIGIYEVDFSVTANIDGIGITTSPITTYTFGVETVPEPTSAALLLGAAGLLALRRRKA